MSGAETTNTQGPDTPPGSAPVTSLARLAELSREHGAAPTSLRHVLPADEDTRRLPVCAFGSSI